MATDRDVSGTVVKVTASNQVGTSDPLITELVKVSPDPPKVNKVYEGDTIITGSIELLDYVIPQEEGNEITEEVPKEFEDAVSEVAERRPRYMHRLGIRNIKEQ